MSTRVYGIQVGRTPLINIDNVWAKQESRNPSGSIKDRMVWYMVHKAEESGALKHGSKIIEVTSGNTGISLAMISALRGYDFTAVIPGSMSVERRRIMESMGATVVITPAEDDMKGALKKYRELVEEYPEAWLPKQFENPHNIEAHERGLGQEIISAKPDIGVFIAGMGTGGTLIGVAKALKKFNPDIHIIGIEPEESAVLAGNSAGLHDIQGIGEGFVPKILRENLHMVDQVISVSSESAKRTAKELAKRGFFVGISSGANVYAARKLGLENVVTVLPDGGEKYISTGLYW